MFLSIFMLTSISQAEDIDAIMDSFYNGLADIIERNMDNPDRCLEEVDYYYKENQEIVDKVSKTLKRYMAEATALMEESLVHEDTIGDYMADGQLDVHKKEAIERSMAPVEPKASPGMNRYTAALEAFTMKHPHHGLKITMKAVEFLPNIKVKE
jgi:hypothetical protein